MPVDDLDDDLDDDLADDERPTEPRIPPEPDTAPDLQRPACPRCRGTKTLLVTETWGSRYRTRRARCVTCEPDGRVSREEFVRLQEIKAATEDD